MKGREEGRGMRVGVLYSGGKDSNMAMYKAHLQGYEIACLVTIVPAGHESMLFHYPNAAHTAEQAECLGLPLVSRHVDAYDVERYVLEDLLIHAMERFAIDGVVTGAIASRYQYEMFNDMAERLGLRHIAPCYGEDQYMHMCELLEHNFSIMITSVSADGLDASMLGRIIDWAMLSRLKDLSIRHGFNVSFEGGEAETFVLDMPMFRKRLSVDGYTVHWDGVRGYIEFIGLSPLDKN
ncbi:MAG: diphthine--ammonia ligase [Candidatus Nitrosocaldus sp.]|nr:diphthine--ammonia ligase [Candidatus Nitrosocaldus sp.]